MTFASIMITLPFLHLVRAKQASMLHSLTFQPQVPSLQSNVFAYCHSSSSPYFFNLSWEFSWEKHWGQRAEREKGKLHPQTIGLLLRSEDNRQEGTKTCCFARAVQL